MSDTEDFKGVMDAAFEYAQPEVFHFDGVPFLIVKSEDGQHELIQMEECVAPFRDRPRRIVESVIVRDPGSLADYMNLYADSEHLARVNEEEHAVSVALDYHESALVAAEYGDNLPRWCQHTVSLHPRFSPQYAAWREIHRKAIGQTAAMEFLEDRMIDIVEPAAADVFEMVMRFEGLTKVTFTQSQRLGDGRMQLRYSEEEAASGSVQFYENIMLKMPIFQGGEEFPVKVRVRHRTPEGKLSFIFVIANIEDIENAAFAQLCDEWRSGLKPDFELRQVFV